MATNIYNFIASVVCDVLYGNIQTLETHNDAVKLFTDTNETLTSAWTSFDPTREAGNPVYAALQRVTPNGGAYPMAQFIKDYLQGTTSYLYDMSTGLCVLMMNTLQSNWDTGDKSPSSSQMSFINQFSSMVGSIGQNEEQTGQNQSKTEGNMVQSDSSAQQSIADEGNTFLSIWGNIGSLLQQAY